jgi:hypothetical protein
MVEAVVWVFEEQDNRAMRAREIWTLIQERGLYTSGTKPVGHRRIDSSQQTSASSASLPASTAHGAEGGCALDPS